MKTITAILATVLLGLSTAACTIKADGNDVFSFNNKRVKASKNYVTKNFNVGNFNQINMAGSGDVYFTQRPGAPAVSVVTSDNIADLRDVYVENNTLYIKFKKGYSITNTDKLDFTIQAENLNDISLAGSGDIKLMNGLTTDKLKLSIAGSGDINCDNIQCSGDVKISLAGSGDVDSHNLQCDDLDLSLAGSGDIKIAGIQAKKVSASIAGSGDFKLQGNTKTAKYSIAGSGDIDADELLAEDVTASTSGSGEITCYASQSFKASKFGSGSIGYKGNPAEVDISKKGVYPIK